MKCKITYHRDTCAYSVSVSGLSRKHITAMRCVLASLAPLDIEVVRNNGVSLPYLRLETFSPMVAVNKSVISTPYKYLRDIQQLFSTSSVSDIPLKETLYSFKTFKKISKYGK